MTYFDSLREKIIQGIEGERIWIPSPYARLKNQLGVAKRMWTIIGGDPGTGKSAFTDTTYIFGAYKWYMENKDKQDISLKIILRSMERSKEYRIAKWVCFRLLMKYGILIDVKTILNLHASDNRVDKDLLKKIDSCKEYFDTMQDEVLTVVDGAENPTGVFMTFRDYAFKNGTLYRNDIDKGLQVAKYYPKDKRYEWKDIPDDRYPEDSLPEKTEWVYHPDDPNEVVIPIVDHIGEYTSEQGLSGKLLLDKAGEYTKMLRDIFGYSPIDVIQFNRNLSDSRRRSGNNLQPEEQDFMGSSTMFHRADVGLALFNPKRYDISRHLNYNINSFTDTYGNNRFRSLFVLKNTYGNSDYGTGMNFIGECGLYRQLPKEMSKEAYKNYVHIAQRNDIIDLTVR